MTLESLKRDSYVSILTRAFARVQRNPERYGLQDFVKFQSSLELLPECN